MFAIFRVSVRSISVSNILLKRFVVDILELISFNAFIVHFVSHDNDSILSMKNDPITANSDSSQVLNRRLFFFFSFFCNYTDSSGFFIRNIKIPVIKFAVYRYCVYLISVMRLEEFVCKPKAFVKNNFLL